MDEEIIYPGLALNEQIPNGKVSGQIILSPHSIRFVYEGGILEFSFQQLVIRRGGSSGHLIFLEHPARPGWTLYTEKRAILKDLKRLSRPDLSDQVTGIRKSRMKLRGIILTVALVIMVLFLGLLQLRTPIAKTVARSFPVEWEQSLGETVFQQYKAEQQIITDPVLQTSLENMAAPLLSAVPEKRYRFHLYIIENPSINAFALPGGYVVLHTGLLLSAETAEEVLGVLAHEISHVTLQHGIRKMIDSLGFFLLLRAVLGDSGGLLGEILEGGAFLLDQKFSRGFERESDEAGFAILVTANINPSGMIGFFQRLHQKSKEQGALSLDGGLNFLSTHPAPDERMNYLQEKWQNLNRKGGYLSFDTEFNSFQEQLKQKTTTEN
jgi:predicted Zn-dependent protease